MSRKLFDAIGIDPTTFLGNPASMAPRELSGPIEPWMKDFVKERHSQEEWDCFFRYVKASRFQRAMMWIGGIVFRAFQFSKETS